MTGLLEVIDGGLLTTVQDPGRPGLAHLGISPSGFLDPPAARLANRLVGNPQAAAVLETTGRGPTLRPRDTGVVVAVAGAAAAILVDGRAADQYASFLLQPGQTLEIGRAVTGLRCYVAVRGGFAVSPVLGSRSTDLLSGLGPPVVRGGHVLPVGEAIAGSVPAADGVAYADLAASPVIGIYPGPSRDWFTREALQLLGSRDWLVDPASSRIGLRLNGPALERCRAGELAPEGMVTGSIQVPPNGLPVLLLADHPTTGGYPVIAVAREADLHHAAQAAPGTAIRFRLLMPGL